MSAIAREAAGPGRNGLAALECLDQRSDHSLPGSSRQLSTQTSPGSRGDKKDGRPKGAHPAGGFFGQWGSRVSASPEGLAADRGPDFSMPKLRI